MKSSMFWLGAFFVVTVVFFMLGTVLWYVSKEKDIKVQSQWFSIFFFVLLFLYSMIILFYIKDLFATNECLSRNILDLTTDLANREPIIIEKPIIIEREPDIQMMVPQQTVPRCNGSENTIIW